MKKVKIKAAIACFMALLMLVNTAPIYVMADTEPEMWYTKSDVTIDKHILFGEDKMYTDGKSNRGFDCLVDNNTGTIFYVSTADPEVNYQNLSGNGKEIMVTVHMSQPVVIDHFKIVAGADTFKANYAHRNPAGWNLKAGNSADSCSTVLVANETIDASEGYKQNVYSFDNTTAYQYYQFTITALAGAGRNGHDSPFSNPTATCTLADIAFGGPAPVSHSDHDDITFTKWDSTNSLPSSAGNYFLDKDITISSTWTVPSGTTNLCLNGHSIKYSGSSSGTGSVIIVSENADLTINDCNTEKTHYYYINSSNLAVITDSQEAASAGNADKNGSFSGGYITGGRCSDGSGSYGGGITVKGTLTMNGGTVIGNSVSGAGGGILVVSSKTTTLSGTNIIGNTTGNTGAGVDVNSSTATVVLERCVFKHNYAQSNTTLGCRGGTVLIKDCDVIGNSAGANANTAGVIAQNCHVTIDGCRITDNYMPSNNDPSARAPGLSIRNNNYSNCSFTLKGNLVIQNNKVGNTVDDAICIHNNRIIKIGGELTNVAPLKVRLQNGSGVFTSGWNTYMSGKEPADYFTSDNADYSVFLNSGGEAVVGVEPVVSITSGGTENTYPSLSDALSNWTDGSTLKLLKDVTTSSTITVNGTKTLDLNGHGIRKTGTGSVIKVNEQSTLNLKDSDTSKEHKYKTASPAGNGAGVATVDDTLTSGYKTFKGGYITGGYITGGYNYGAGINVEGNGATLNMYGGTIIGNKLTAGSTGGGGVCLQDWDKSGGFNMYGGSIIGNTSNYGGGVYVRCGKMVLYDGEISNNVAHSNNIGGAVLAFGDKSTFIMEGGTINGNLAQHGGAIEASGSATVSVFGGTITNNTANGKGGALTNQRSDGDTSPAVFNISGAPVFSGNTAGGKSSDVYLCNTAVLNVTDEMTNTTPILVSRSNGSGTFTSGWKDKMGEADPAAYFTAEVSNYQVRRIRNGEAYVGLPHTHNWSYTANGDTITAKCSEYDSGLCALETQTIKISASGKVYDGTAVTATLTKSDGWTTDNSLATPEITYSGNTDAGTYTASITLGEATASAEFTIDEASMADEVSAQGCTVDYDGNSHGITVTKPDGATVKYGTEISSCTLSESPTYKNAGEYTVYYTVTKKNYITVTGSETVKINKINAVVTITGNNSTVDYDGADHKVTGYVATPSTNLYDVSKDFTFSGCDEAIRKNAGTTYMGLAAEQFANTNSNFATVIFEVTDGYVTVNTVDAVITTAPATANPIYNGSKLKLVKAGKVDGGTLLYALGENPKSAPDESSFKTSIPTAKKTGSYYVWYRVAADKNHFDIAPQCIKVVIAEEDWVTLSGVLYQKDGKTPIENATITLMKGSNKVDYEITATDGKYQFIVPAGVYNIVTTYNGKSETTAAELFKTKKQDISMLGGNTESVVDINSDTEGFDVVVGGLNEEAKAIRIADGLKDEQNLSLKMTVEAKTVETANNSKAFTDLSVNTTFMFFDVQLEKTVDSKITVLKNSRNVLEIAVPYEKINRKDLAAYYCDGSKVKKLKESDSGEDGTFRIDKKNGFVYIYSTSFSTFAIGYTPYYTLDSNVVLGSFGGNVNVSLVGMGGEGVYRLENVSLNKIGFANVPKGRYKMTVTWTDGVENTLTMPITVS